MNSEVLKNDYLNGMSIKELCIKHSIKNESVIYYYLNKLGVKNRGKQKPYKNPFIQESPERDYWLGWIFSDGCIVKTKTHKKKLLYLSISYCYLPTLLPF